MSKTYFFRILSFLVVFIIVFSSFLISVSAATEDSKGYYFNIQQPVANSNSGYIELITENWGPILVYFNASFQYNFHDNNVNDGAFNFYATVEQNRLIIRNHGQISAVDGFNNTQYVTIWGFYVTPLGWSEWRYSSYGDESLSFPYNTFNISLGSSGNITKARGYNCNLDSLDVGSNFNPFVYGSDTALYNEMKVIEELLRQNVAGNQAIIDDADKNASQIQSNADKNASQIQSNADKNASHIQQNQDKNTNKVINGGTDNPHYSSADTTTTDDYANKEKELNNKTVSARSSTVNFFNNFYAMLNDTNVSRGLLAVSKVMTEFFSIGWVAGIVQFALALGSFAFILGSVVMVVGRLSSKESRTARTNYYKSRTEYYKSRSKK